MSVLWRQSVRGGYLCISLGPLAGWGWGLGRTRYSPCQCSLDRRYTSPRYCKSAGRRGECSISLIKPLFCHKCPVNKLKKSSGQQWRTYPVVRADARVRGARADAEVEGVDGVAATLQTHHVRPAWGPVLHVAQIQAIIQHCVAAPAGQTVTLNHAYFILLVIEFPEYYLSSL